MRQSTVNLSSVIGLASPKRALILTGVFFSTLFVALFLSFVLHSAPAFASGTENCGLLGSEGCVDTGGGNPGGGGGGNCNTSTGCAGETPQRSYSSRPFNINNVTYFVGCERWGYPLSSPTSYRLSTSCNTGLSAIINRGNALYGSVPGFQSGGVRWFGSSLVGSLYPYASQCSPQGENSAYGGTFRREANRIVEYEVLTWPNRGPDGTDLVIRNEINSYVITNFSQIGCSYPQPVVAVDRYCFWNYAGTSYFSRDRNAIQTGGTLVNVRGSLPGDPRRPVWNGPSSAPQCDQIGRADVIQTQDLSENGYGYYRLVPTFNWNRYIRTDWVGGGTVFRSIWSNPNNGAGDNRGWFVYSCRADNPYEGRFTYAQLPNRNQFFDEASCPQVTWRCEIADSTTSGGIDRALIPSGQTQVNTVVTVIRNGEPVPIRFSRLRVIDVTDGVTTDITDGGSGSGVRNIERLEYRSLVRNGSTPFNGTNITAGSQLNAGNQYFRLFTSPAGSTSEPWMQWRADANGNLDKSISFYWATETDTGSFAAQRQWRVTAEFFVPQGTYIDSDGNFGSYGYAWVRDTKNCYTVNSSGEQTTTLLTATSNPIRVVRSVNDTN